MASNPNPPGLGFPFFPPNPYPYAPAMPRPPPRPQPPPFFPPPIRPPPTQPPPPRRAPPPPTQPPPPPRRAPPPPTLPPLPPRRAPPPPTLPPLPPRRAPPPPSTPPPLPPRRAPPPPSLPPMQPPPTPPPSPPHVVIIVVFVSLGGLLLLACLAAYLCWHKKNRRTEREEAEIRNFNDHAHVHKATVADAGGGAKATVLSVDEDISFQAAAKQQEAAGEGSTTAAAARHHSGWLRHGKQESSAEQKAELINVTEHVHADEKIVPGPHGQRIEILSEDVDIRFQDAQDEEEASQRSNARIAKF